MSNWNIHCIGWHNFSEGKIVNCYLEPKMTRRYSIILITNLRTNSGTFCTKKINVYLVYKFWAKTEVIECKNEKKEMLLYLNLYK